MDQFLLGVLIGAVFGALAATYIPKATRAKKN